MLKHQIHLMAVHKIYLEIVCSFPFFHTFVCQSWVCFSCKESTEIFSSFSWKINLEMDDFCIMHSHLYFVHLCLNFLNTAFNSGGSWSNSHVSTLVNCFWLSDGLVFFMQSAEDVIFSLLSSFHICIFYVVDSAWYFPSFPFFLASWVYYLLWFVFPMTGEKRRCFLVF